MLEVKILELDLTTEEAMKSCIHGDLSLKLKVSLTRRLFRESGKAFVELKGARDLRLLKANYIKIEWLSCMVRRRAVASRCYRCLGFGHMAAQCGDPDRSRCYWKCGAKGHTAAVWMGKLQSYLCAQKEKNSRTDQLSKTTRCAAFQEATLERKLWEDARGAAGRIEEHRDPA